MKPTIIGVGTISGAKVLQSSNGNGKKFIQFRISYRVPNMQYPFHIQARTGCGRDENATLRELRDGLTIQFRGDVEAQAYESKATKKIVSYLAVWVDRYEIIAAEPAVGSPSPAPEPEPEPAQRPLPSSGGGDDVPF